jgi:hypothetical protein
MCKVGISVMVVALSFSVSQTEVIVTLKVLVKGGGRGMCGKAATTVVG